MKLDNKGFTVIELILSFIFVMFLAIAMFSLINNYHEKEEREAIKSRLETLKNTLTTDIYQDTIKRKVRNMEYCLDSSDEVIDGCIVINFLDNTSKKLQIAHEVIEVNDEGHYFTYTSDYLLYGGVKYNNPDPRFAKVVNDYMLISTTDIDKLEYGVIYKINLRIKKMNLL